MEEQMVSPGGMTVATLTPYDREGRVDPGAAREHAAWLVEAGIRTLAPVGTTGEALYLEAEEKRHLIRAVVDGAKGRAAVIAGIWALRPVEIHNLHAAAVDAGASAVFLTTPIYYPATEDAVVAFYEFARAAGPLPVYAYNIPQYAMNEVSPAVLERLAAAGTVAGVKESTGKVERLRLLIDQFRGRLAIFGASDGTALTARQFGADGFISALANVFPRTFRRIWEDTVGSAPSPHAVAAQSAVDQLRGAVKGHGGIAALKHLLGHRGFSFHGTRLPFQELDDAARAELDRVMDEAEGLD
jgi:4-hydroxy-tetrahydrodipicolinate synthase